MLFVVGVGLKREHLTDEAKKVISNAEKVYGSKKAMEIAKDLIKGEAVILTRFGKEVYEEIEKESQEKNIAVLSTGDPMVAGLGRFFKSAKIISGISSIQVALSRLGVDLCDVEVYNAHSGEPEVKLERDALILAKKGYRVNFKARKIIILENLESENEKIYEVKAPFVVKNDYTIIFVKVRD